MANTNNPQFGRPAEEDPDLAQGEPIRDPLVPDDPQQGVGATGGTGLNQPAEQALDPISGRPVFGASGETHESSGGSQDDEGGAAQEAQRVAGNAGDRARDVSHTAQDEASRVARTSQQAGGDVMDTARQEAGHVVDEAKAQGRYLLDASIGELRSQADQGQHRIAGVVRSLSDELGSMSDNATERGVMVDLVDQVQRYGRDAADFLDNNGPDDVLETVRRYAARNPWTFMAISAGVGFLAARLVRGLNRDDSDDDGSYRAGSRDYQRQGRASDLPGGAVPVTGAHDPLATPDPYRTSTPGALVEDEVRGDYGGIVEDDQGRGEIR